MQLFSGNTLQAAEQSIRRSVTAGKGNSQPSEEGAEEGIEPTRMGKGQSQDGISPRVSSNKSQAQHTGDGQDSPAHSIERVAENLNQFYRIHSSNQPADDCSQEAARPRGGKPDELEAGALW